MLKFDIVDLDKKSVKFYGVSPMDTSFKNFILNLFYEKWILDFELDPNIWIWIFKKSNLLFLKKLFLIENLI